ncbi:MAG: hypothetical protein OHK0053_01020 [Microscillaceae bacterium]
MRAFHTFLLLGLIFSLAACRPHFFEKYHKIPEARWDKAKALEYLVPVRETGKNYRLTLLLSHFANIEAPEIQVLVQIKNAKGKEILKQIYPIRLKNEAGEPRGEVAGGYADWAEVLSESLPLPQPGDYDFFISQATDFAVLEGLTRVGLRVDSVHP